MHRNYYDKKIKQQARRLRGNGFSFKEISEKLGIAKSTARLWTKDIQLKPEHRKRLYTKGIEALRRSPNNSKERRKREIEAILKLAEKDISLPIDSNTFKLLGAALYWAEGDKTKNFSITNSDPLLIKFMVEWMKSSFKITLNQLKANLNIYSQQNDLEMKRFWSELTGIPLKNFGKSFIKPANKGFKKNTLYYGTIKVRMNKGGDAIHRVFGWIKMLLKDLKIDVDSIETKWNKLKTDFQRSF